MGSYLRRRAPDGCIKPADSPSARLAHSHWPCPGGHRPAHFRIFRHSRASLGLPAISGPGSHGVAPTSHAINSIASSSTHTHTLSLSLSYTLSIRSLFPSLVTPHRPWTATACISLANGS